ncbi:MAG TPA: FkbM family methyltransferase [Methylomirabilota bacterium]|nr:FkbM family methyltransferase [Methylomirabilota bacterium]
MRSARGLAGVALGTVLRRLVTTPAGLRAVNNLHRRLDLAAKRRFYYLGCDDETCLVEGPWLVDFGGRALVLPLHRRFRFAWTAAIAFHGHDTEIHHYYETAVTGPQPPRVFFDVGASYGLHSLKLLAHGARVVSFEPNPACHPFFTECCERNRLHPEIEPVAVGAWTGTAELAVPGSQTYLGTIAGTVKHAWRERPDVVTRTVPRVTLDAFAEERRITPDLVKIDVEGSELAVLEGAHDLLERARPLVVLESWPGSRERAEIFALLGGHGYDVRPLAFPPLPDHSLSLASFLESPDLNFLARPTPSC